MCIRDSFGGGTIGGLVSTTFVVLFLGLSISTLRWLVIDSIHHWTGIRTDNWNFEKLNKNLAAFESLGGFQYHYYQFYANSIVAIVVANVILKADGWPLFSGVDFIFLAWLVLFWLGSRDTLRKYYRRVEQVLC